MEASDALRPTLDEVKEAATRIKHCCLRSPLVPLAALTTDSLKVYLKLESLQPTGSFKDRGSSNAIGVLRERGQLDGGVYTSSVGNFAQGLAWHARRDKVPCTVVVPLHAQQRKLDALQRLGAQIHKVPFDEWWEVMLTNQHAQMPGTFVHPCADRAVIAGNGTVALELLEDLPELTTVVAPYGGGGLSCGIASTLSAVGRNDVSVYACEVDVAAPLHASLAAGKPSQVVDHQHSFVDGMGGKAVLPSMWPMASTLLRGSYPVTLPAVVQAMQLLAEAGLVAEGAGAAPLVPVMDGRVSSGHVVCVISGRNIDSERLRHVLAGKVPQV